MEDTQNSNDLMDYFASNSTLNSHRSITYFGFSNELINAISSLKEGDIVLVAQPEEICDAPEDIPSSYHTLITTTEITWDSEFVSKYVFTKDEKKEIRIADFENEKFIKIKEDVRFVTIIEI